MSAVLTRRQAEVLDHLCSGLTNKEIGVKMGLCESTIKDHLALAMQKLGGRTRVQTALIWAQARPGYVKMWDVLANGPLFVPLPVVVVPDLPPLSPIDQFWALVRRREQSCWIWEGPLHRGPRCSIPGLEELGTNARHIAYALERGERVPEGQRVAMTCNTARCVSPDHMRVTSVQNRPHFDKPFGRRLVDGKGSRKEDD